MGLLSGYQTPERRWIREVVLLSASWSIEIAFGGQSLPWLGKSKYGECYCQFTNISMGRSIGQASSGALGNSSIVPAIRTDGNLHLRVGIWLALTPLFHSDSSVHFLLLTSVWSATTTHSIRKLSLLSLFAWSIRFRRLIEKELLVFEGEVDSTRRYFKATDVLTFFIPLYINNIFCDKIDFIW